MILMYPYFIALVIYLLIKVCICSTLSHEVARIFFLSSSACRNFFLVQFFGSDTPPPLPGYLIVHSLEHSKLKVTPTKQEVTPSSDMFDSYKPMTKMIIITF